jgi:hypothetical protein
MSRSKPGRDRPMSPAAKANRFTRTSWGTVDLLSGGRRDRRQLTCIGSGLSSGPAADRVQAPAAVMMASVAKPSISPAKMPQVVMVLRLALRATARSSMTT